LVDEIINKPSYDGRLQFYDVFGGYMKAMAQAVVDKNYSLWYNCLRSMLSMSKPFITSEDIKEIENLLSIAKNSMREKKLSFYVEEKLFQAEDAIHRSAKHLLLPISTDTITEWSEEDFLKESDL